MKTYYLRSFGCQMNEHDAERIRALLEAEGLEDVGDAELADVLVFNTCTVRKSADDRLTAHLCDAAAIKRRRPGGCRIIVTGCLPQAEKEALFERFPFVDAALGPQNLYRLPQVLRGAATRGLFADGPHMSGDLPARRARPFQAWVQVMSGCTNRCSYCIVPQVRGPERSRTPETIIAEVERLAAEGVREVTLLGQNVNAYGKDLALSRGAPRPSFAGLMRDLDRIHGR
jgi:tRNA-2-methylthio-N6-dimethylallyladenosine synthase